MSDVIINNIGSANADDMSVTDAGSTGPSTTIVDDDETGIPQVQVTNIEA